MSSFEPGEDPVVQGRRDSVVIVKSFVQRHIANRLGPIAILRRTREIHPQMPLANHRSLITILLEHRCDRHATIGDQTFGFGPQHSTLHPRPPWIATGEQRVA